MGAAYFYHLTRSRADQALLLLLPKCLDAGWRVYVRVSDQERAEEIDERLWLGPDDGFLPHGVEGGPHDSDQPILIGTQTRCGYDCLMTLDGVTLSADEVQNSSRSCILFVAGDAAQMATARQQWVDLTAAGCAAQYWSQESGKWALKARKDPS